MLGLKQVLGGMRFNGLPPMQQAQKDAKTEKRERAALEAESEALAAMAQQPVMRVNGQEPDCLTAESCLGPSTAQRLARARSVGVGGMGGIEIGGGSGLL